MSKERASIFDAEPVAELDVSGFAPRTARNPAAPSADAVKAVAEAANFPSREARKVGPLKAEPTSTAAAATSPAEARRQPRRHRTGRTAQFNARTTPETVQAFYAIADQEGWLVGETIENALAALQRELNAKGKR